MLLYFAVMMSYSYWGIFILYWR